MRHANLGWSAGEHPRSVVRVDDQLVFSTPLPRSAVRIELFVAGEARVRERVKDRGVHRLRSSTARHGRILAVLVLDRRGASVVFLDRVQQPSAGDDAAIRWPSTGPTQLAADPH